jgi:TolB protein
VERIYVRLQPKGYAMTMFSHSWLKTFLVVVTASIAFMQSPSTQAGMKVDITQGVVSPIPIAITNFYAADGSEQMAKMGQDISGVVSKDLERSGLFRPLDPRAFVQAKLALETTPRYADWRILNAQALVVGRASMGGDGNLTVEFRLFDVIAENQIEGLAFTAQAADWRRIGHKIADAIYKRLTGEEGYFDTRIAYVAEQQKGTRRMTRLAIMDQDGANHRYLSEGATLVMTPRFSPNLHLITYMDYGTRKQPRVYLMNTHNGQKQMLGHFPGMTFAPRFGADAQTIVMSMSQSGNSSLFTMNLTSKAVTRLTNVPAIDTSPCFSPDGRQIAFNSDRDGSRQLYTMNIAEGVARRISFGGGKYAAPVWSPRGDWIAFIKMEQGMFYLGVMKPDGTGERLLAQGFVLDSPTWAPNGRVIMFERQTPLKGKAALRKRLFSIDLTGYNERELATPGDASGPAWSPLIP